MTSRRKKNKSGQDTSGLQGILFIGDPHVQSTNPDFRKDNFLETILGKIQWCLDYAKEERLLPAFLGDLFQHARNNPNVVIVRLMQMLQDSGAIGIYGNHDCRETKLNENDSLSILVTSGVLKLVSVKKPWTGRINGRRVVVTGSSYRDPIEHEFDLETVRKQLGPDLSLFEPDPFVAWMSHHDIDLNGYDSGKFKPYPIRNVDVLINGHIHRELESVQAGRTTWMNPGNIARRKRSDANRKHIPHATRIDINEDDWRSSCVKIPHKPFDEVFYEFVADEKFESTTERSFANGLKELQTRRTQSGAGLHQFLNASVDQFEKPVARELLALASAVTAGIETSTQEATTQHTTESDVQEKR